MASHGGSRHYKRIAVPHLTAHERKVSTWVKKPAPGRHPLGEALALSTLLRDVLGAVDDVHQARALLREGKVIVDGVKATSVKMPVGLMDILSIPAMGKTFRILVTGGKLAPVLVPASAAKAKLVKVTGKRYVPGGKVQLNFHDGRSALVSKEEDRFATGDTVKLAVPAQKIEGFVKLEKGARCYVHKGRHAGALATLQEIMERAGSRAADARLTTDEGKELITLKSYLFAVEKDFRAQDA